MSRRRRAIKREISPDPRHGSVLVSQFVNILMKCGKKQKARRIVYDAFDYACEELKKSNPVDALNEALANVRPKVEVKSRRVGGATYQVPVEISFQRQQSLALRWFKVAAASRKGLSMSRALSKEIVDAYNNTGTLIKKREEAHKMAQANRAFAHLKW